LLKLFNIFKCFPGTVIFYDQDMRVKWMNEAALNEYNTSLQEVTTLDCEYFRGRNTGSEEECLIKRVFNTGKNAEEQQEFSNGKVFLVKASPIINNKNRVTGVISIGFELVNYYKMRENLEKEKRKNDFFVSLSHEIRTPINLMNATFQLLESKTKKGRLEDSYLTEKLRLIRQSNNYLIRLINNLLDLNKIDKGYYTLKMQNIDIIDIIRNIVLSCQDYINNEGKSIKFMTDLEQRIIACNLFSIERVILNLISNAVKFTKNGDEIIIHIENFSDTIRISILDTGIGIPESEQNEIFNLFTRMKNPDVAEKEGCGMGLAIVKAFVKLHQGKISLKSKPGIGSEFIIELPTKTLPVENDKFVAESKETYNLSSIISIELSDFQG
jgi:two-component system, chemotaxis family, CheB/CheR fusion protein